MFTDTILLAKMLNKDDPDFLMSWTELTEFDAWMTYVRIFPESRGKLSNDFGQLP